MFASLIGAAFVLSAIAVSAPAAPLPDAAVAGDRDTGERVFRAHCARCHGIHGEGGEGPGLVRETLRHARDDAALLALIRDGIPGTAMPGAFGPSERELLHLVAYVKGLGRIEPEPLPGNPARGRLLYDESGCATCHIVQGRGTGIGPELTSVGARRGLDYLRESLIAPSAALPMLAGYAQYLVVRAVTRDGEVTGMRVSEDAFTIQIRDSAGTLHSLRKADLTRLEKKFGHSLMPGYETGLSTRQQDDLVSYLMTLRGEP